MRDRSPVYWLVLSAMLCALIAVSTLWLKFPLPGTELLFTTQVLFVLLCGQLLPPRYCLLALGAYVLLGLCGAPVFSATQGLAVVATPTFGYLLAFPFAAALEARCLARFRSRPWARWLAVCVGLAAVYALALGYIAALKGLYQQAPIGFSQLMSAYCLLFLPLDAVKAVLAVWVAQRLSKRLGQGSSLPMS